MKCPKCDGKSEVLETRQNIGYISRRRECSLCKHRFTTNESETFANKSLARASSRLRLLGFTPSAIQDILGCSPDTAKGRNERRLTCKTN